MAEQNKTQQAILGFVTLAAAAYFLFGTSSNPKSDAAPDMKDSSEASQPPAITEPPIELTSVELAKAYEANTVAADQKYNKRLLRITGIVQSISTDITGNAYLDLNGVNQFLAVRAELRKGQEDKAAKLMKGDKVVLDCIGAGDVIKSPVNKDCDVIQMLRRK